MTGGSRPDVPPSGRQVEIRYGDARATLAEVGGGLRCYRTSGREVVDGYDIDEMCSAARGQSLLPWPNRISGGTYRWEARDLRLPLDEPDKGNAIHGLTRWRNWVVADATDDRVVFELRLHPQEGYPFALDLSLEYALGPAGLSVTTRARNIGGSTCPFASGAHPYLTVGTDRIDETALELPAATYLETDDRGIPTRRRAVAGTAYDFRSPRPIGATRIDNAFTDLRRDSDGLVRVGLQAPDPAAGGRSVTLWADDSYDWLEIFTADGLAQGSRRGLAVEPMTAPPNAFVSGESVRRLAVGEETVSRWGISPTV